MRTDTYERDTHILDFGAAHNDIETKATTRAVLSTMRAEEDADRDDWADDGDCVDGESGGDPMLDLPEMETILKNIYDM